MLENMLDYVRIFLYVSLLILGFLLFQAWQVEHPPVTIGQTQSSESATHFVPNTSVTTPVPMEKGTTPSDIPAPTKGQIVTVTTDRLQVAIDTQGGDLIQAKLLQYPESLGSKQPFLLLNDNPKTRYIAESGLLSAIGPDTKTSQALYSVDQANYALAPNQHDVVVNLHWQKDGIQVIKRFIFTRGSYEVKVRYEISNQGNTAWEGNFYAQLVRTNSPPETQSGLVNLTTFFGAAVSTPNKPFEKIAFKSMQDNPVNLTTKDGWAAMIQHYFITAWVPTDNTQTNYYSNVTANGLYTIGLLGSKIVVPPNGQFNTEAKLYTGPTIGSELEKTASTLKLTIDYGWFWFIAIAIFWLMQTIYDFIGNWGLSIILVTVFIKLLFYHLSAKSYRSMSALKRLQPRIELLRERYGDDKPKLTQSTLELYRQEKVNPMSGCLPILIQIPVFIALYWVLVESVQLRQAPFILWIHDLSQKDPYYILPILMGISMFIQQRLNPPPPDPLQAKVMLAMPLIFTILFKDFPAGLMLYWFVNNTLSFLQQWYVMRSINAKT